MPVDNQTGIQQDDQQGRIPFRCRGAFNKNWHRPRRWEKNFYFIWYMFLKSVVDLFSLFCLSELKLCQLTNTEESNKRMWDYLKLSLSGDRCENCNDPYDFELNSFQLPSECGYITHGVDTGVGILLGW